MPLHILDTTAAPALRQPWKNAIAVGRAYELLREDVLTHLREVQRRIGYRYCRFHGLFHDEMGVVARRENGALAFSWHQVDKVYDALLAMGLRPFVELNPMPSALASGVETIFDWKMNVTPPADFAEWEELVEAFTRHLLERYGLDEIRQWYFEVWNEPNLGGFWTGSQSDYWQLYDASARAIKRVSPELRIGGPASSKANWIEDMIRHCAENHVPLDFVSTHLYPQDECVTYADRQGSPHEPGNFFIDTVRSVQRIVRESVMPDLEIHWTEWNVLSAPSTAGVSWTTNETIDSIFGAAAVIRYCIALDGACDTLCWWVASDVFEECGMPHAEFSCTYGLLTLNGLPKASCRAFELLNRLRGARLATRADEPLPPGCGVVATQEGDRRQILLWHQIMPEHAQTPWQVTLSWPKREAQSVIQIRIAPGAGSAWETWVGLGRPQNLSPLEMELLRAHAEPEFRLLPADAESCEIALPPGEVCFLELRPRGLAALPKTQARAALAEWEQKMSAASRESQS